MISISSRAAKPSEVGLNASTRNLIIRRNESDSRKILIHSSFIKTINYGYGEIDLHNISRKRESILNSTARICY